MRRFRSSALALAAVLALAAPGCIGDDDDGGDETLTEPTISVPTETQSVPTETTTAPTGGTPTPAPKPSKPDSPTNDLPPKPGSPQERFEQYCEQNPGACG